MIAFLSAQIRVIMAAIGLGLLSYGCALAWLPLAFIVPGAALLALPVIGVVAEARRMGEQRRAGR